MERRPLQSSRGFVLDLRLVEAALSLPAVGVVVFYLNGVLTFSLRDWVVFTQSIGLYVLVLSIAGEFWRRRWWWPIREYLDAAATAPRDPALAVAAFAAAMDLPRRFLVFHLVAWAIAGAVGAAGMALWSGREWAPFESFTTLLAGLTGGVVAAGFVFFGLRERLASLRAAFAEEVPDPRERTAHVRSVSLRTKLLLTVASSGLASVLFAALLAYASASNGMLRMIGDWQTRALRAAPESAAPDVLGDAPATPAEGALGPPVSLVRLDPGGSGAHEALGRPLAEEIVRHVEQGASSSTWRRDGRIATWRRLADGSILVAVTPAASLESFLSSVAGTIAIFLGLAVGVSMILVGLFARDVDHATRALTESAQRLAKGELRHGEPFESEDELGQLARTYQQTADALRALVGDVASAAGRVDGAAGDLSSVSQRVAGGASEQAREMDRAAVAMEELYERVQRLSGAAAHLTTSMDTAGDSIAELGTGSEQLRDTAGLLAGNAHSVSASVEELIRSSRGVAESSATLGAAASETSKRMDLMANAMRLVNAAAEKMSDLVNGVQRSAEVGRARMGETSQGMSEIQRATETAGRVVHRLVAAAKEIATVLDVIDDVADETNLLALNAAVIAAQAGESGRPFAVVADHVRELAGRVLASTSEIDALIRALQDESSQAVSAIDHGMQRVSEGVELAAQAGLSLDEIAAAAGETGAFTRQIVTAVGEQTDAATEVVHLMSRVLAGVEQIGAAEDDRSRGNDRIASAARSMLEVAQQVRGTTEEQARGQARIQQASGDVRNVAAGMKAALQEQTAACAEIARVLEGVLGRTRESSGEAQTMAEAVKRLADEAERLRQRTRRFEL